MAEYNPSTNSWRARASIPTPRTGVAVAELNGEIWVIGGAEDTNPGGDHSRQATNIVEIYNPSTNAWRTGPAFPENWVVHAATSLNGKVYVSGGWIQRYAHPMAWQSLAACTVLQEEAGHD